MALGAVKATNNTKTNQNGKKEASTVSHPHDGSGSFISIEHVPFAWIKYISIVLKSCAEGIITVEMRLKAHLSCHWEMKFPKKMCIEYMLIGMERVNKNSQVRRGTYFGGKFWDKTGPLGKNLVDQDTPPPLTRVSGGTCAPAHGAIWFILSPRICHNFERCTLHFIDFSKFLTTKFSPWANPPTQNYPPLTKQKKDYLEKPSEFTSNLWGYGASIAKPENPRKKNGWNCQNGCMFFIFKKIMPITSQKKNDGMKETSKCLMCFW